MVRHQGQIRCSSNLDFIDAADQRELADELIQFYTRFNDLANPELATVPPVLEPATVPPVLEPPEPPDKAPDGSQITIEEARAQLRQCQPEKAAGSNFL